MKASISKKQNLNHICKLECKCMHMKYFKKICKLHKITKS